MGGEGGGEEKSLSLISESITHTLSHSLFFFSLDYSRLLLLCICSSPVSDSVAVSSFQSIHIFHRYGDILKGGEDADY